jgi:hypothetical protein
MTSLKLLHIYTERFLKRFSDVQAAQFQDVLNHVFYLKLDSLLLSLFYFRLPLLVVLYSPSIYYIKQALLDPSKENHFDLHLSSNFLCFYTHLFIFVGYTSGKLLLVSVSYLFLFSPIATYMYFC